MRIWFWAWVVVAVAIAVVSALARDRYSAPWAAGAACAAALEAVRSDPLWQWVAFLVVSMIVFVALNRVRDRDPRRGGAGEPLTDEGRRPHEGNDPA